MKLIYTLFTLLFTLIYTQESKADFKVGLECDNCTDTQYRSLARNQLNLGNFGKVYIFDFTRNNLKKYHVEASTDFPGRVWIAQMTTTNIENEIFNDMDSVVEAAGMGDFDLIGPGSAYDYIGCPACETNLGLFAINNHTWSIMWRELISQSTDVFEINTGSIDFSFDYNLVITFADGSQVTLTMVNGQLKAIQDSYFDSDNNPIPHNQGDLSDTYLFQDGSSGSNFQNFRDRLDSWNINWISNGLTGALSCSFSCLNQVCTLECKRI